MTRPTSLNIIRIHALNPWVMSQPRQQNLVLAFLCINHGAKYLFDKNTVGIYLQSPNDVQSSKELLINPYYC